MSELIQRIPPNSIRAEQSVLGAMLLDKEAISTASETKAMTSRSP